MPIHTVRDHRLDIAKGVLICLVVLGHLLEGMNYWRVSETRIPLTIIYAFHMPAFAFLAGITAKPTNLLRRIGPLLVLMVLFQAAYYGFVLLFGLKKAFALDTPFWILWFLFALACWTLLTPLMARYPKSAIAIAIAAALIAVTLPWVGYPYSAARALAFLPFFTLGFAYGKRILAWAAAATLPLKGVLVAGSVLVAVTLLGAQLSPSWFYGSMSADRLKADLVEAVLVRGGLMVGAAVLTLTLLVLVPNRRNAWATVGRRSLSVYLLHGFLVLAVTPYLKPMLSGSPSTALLILAVLAAGTVTLAATPGVDRSLRRIGAAAFPPRGRARRSAHTARTEILEAAPRG